MSEEFLSYFVLNYSSSSFFFLPRSLNPSPPAPRDATAMLTHPQMLVASPVFALSLFLEVEVLDTLLLASGVDVAFGVLVGVFVGCVVGIVVGAVVGGCGWCCCRCNRRSLSWGYGRGFRRGNSRSLGRGYGWGSL